MLTDGKLAMLLANAREAVEAVEAELPWASEATLEALAELATLAAHGAVAHIEEPRVVRELKAERDQLQRACDQLAAERERLRELVCKGDLAVPFFEARKRIAELEAREGERLTDALDNVQAYEARLQSMSCDLVEGRDERDAALFRLDAERARRKQAEADLRQRTGERDGALVDVARLTEQLNDREAAGFQRASADFVERQERDALRARVVGLEYEAAVYRALNAEAHQWREQADQERDAARATVERVRAELAAHEVIDRDVRDAWAPHSLARIEAALTPPGDGGSR
jgi:hypothetical protein